MLITLHPSEMAMADFSSPATGWIWTLIILVAAPAVALIIHTLLHALALRLTRLTSTSVDESLINHARRPTRWIFPLAAILFVLPELPLAPDTFTVVRHGFGVALIAATAWLLTSLLSVVDDEVARRFPMNVSDNLRARSVLTQIRVLRRIAIVVITIIASAIILMTFPTIRHIGDSILASA
ncbi:MAG: hypothetical protein ACRENQ_07795 [Gemmatimonadaceae bacterium]